MLNLKITSIKHKILKKDKIIFTKIYKKEESNVLHYFTHNFWYIVEIK